MRSVIVGRVASLPMCCRLAVLRARARVYLIHACPCMRRSRIRLRIMLLCFRLGMRLCHAGSLFFVLNAVPYTTLLKCQAIGV